MACALGTRVSLQPTTSADCVSRQKPSSENHLWGGITAWASTHTARLSWLWKRRIYWIPERSFSPSPALSATCLETGLHYRWAPGSHYTLTALRLPPSRYTHIQYMQSHQHVSGICVDYRIARIACNCSASLPPPSWTSISSSWLYCTVQLLSISLLTLCLIQSSQTRLV